MTEAIQFDLENINKPRVRIAIRTLGYLGAIPFITAIGILYSGVIEADVVASLLQVYALSVFAFLSGIWWVVGIFTGKSGLIWGSNFLLLISLYNVVSLDSSTALFVLAAMYAVMWLCESAIPPFRVFNKSYFKMRTILTAIVCFSLILCSSLL